MTPFLELKPGSNIIRLLTLPYQYMSHPKLKRKDTPAHGQKLKCPSIMLGTLQCDLCKEYKSRPRWMIGCLARLDNKVYLIDIDLNIFKSLRDYARHQRWGDPTKYDIDIILDDGEIKLIPIPSIMDFDTSKYPVDLDELTRLSKPNLQDLDIIAAKNYEEVKHVYRSQDYDY